MSVRPQGSALFSKSTTESPQRSVAKWVVMLAAAYPNRPALEAITIDHYVEALSKLDPELLRVSFEKARETLKFFPTIAELVALYLVEERARYDELHPLDFNWHRDD